MDGRGGDARGSDGPVSYPVFSVGTWMEMAYLKQLSRNMCWRILYIYNII